MRITRQTETELQLEDSGAGLVAFGVLAIAVAVLTAGFALHDGKLAAAIIVLGGFGSAGIVMLRRAEAVIHHFDIQRAILTVDTRPVLAVDDDDRKAVTYPLHALADLTLEESTSADSDGTRTLTFRPVYRFQDGTRLPLLPYYTSQRSTQEQIQAAVRAIIASCGAGQRPPASRAR